MQLLARYRGEENERPTQCRRCGGSRFHRHGFYKRWVLWMLNSTPERVKVNRYFCVRCGGTTSLLPWGILSYRLLSLGIVIKHLYDRQEQRWRELLSAYRRRWKGWYPQLWRGIGNLMGRLPREADEGWEALGFEEVNPKLVDQSGWSLFGHYRIHAPQRVL